jgi:hypothetical protein
MFCYARHYPLYNVLRFPRTSPRYYIRMKETFFVSSPHAFIILQLYSYDKHSGTGRYRQLLFSENVLLYQQRTMMLYKF